MIIIFCILSTLLLLFYFSSLKNTVFGINLNKGNYTGFFVFYTLLIYIIPSVLLLNTFPIDYFWVAFKVQQDSVVWISLLILGAMFLFYAMLSVNSVFNPKTYYIKKVEGSVDRKAKIFVNISIIICLLAIAFAWLVFGTGHAFTLSIMDDISISSLRYEAQGNTSVKILKHLFLIIAPFLAAIVASKIYDQQNIKRLFLISCILFIASWGGSKAPVLNVLIVYFATRATFSQAKINIKTLLSMIIGVVALLWVTYRVVLLQYSDMIEFSAFWDYFSQRVFVAQMIGVYEQFNLFIHNPSYIWHGIPFASSFVDYPVFQKDLMMISEDRTDASSIGIKNSLFIAEAYAMGGVFLLVLSPLWIAITFALNFKIILFLFNRLIFNNIEYAKIVVSIALFSYVNITGGFSDLMFFKITIMLIILLLPFMVATRIISRFRLRK